MVGCSLDWYNDTALHLHSDVDGDGDVGIDGTDADDDNVADDNDDNADGNDDDDGDHGSHGNGRDDGNAEGCYPLLPRRCLTAPQHKRSEASPAMACTCTILQGHFSATVARHCLQMWA